MDRIFVFLGLISCLIALSSAAEFVTVGQDIKVKPTQSPLLNPDNKVNVTLNCTGSKSDLSYYIRNSLCWFRILPDGDNIQMTRNFYPASDLMQRKFEKEFKYTLEYGPLAVGGINFALNIIGLTLQSIDLTKDV